MTAAKLIATLALAAVAAAPASPVTTLAGRYSRHFQNGLIDGSKYWSEDVVEIVPVDATHAYFNADLQFYNGHSCTIFGIAKAVDGKLVYAEKQSSYDGGPTCRLSITVQGRKLLLDDGENSCHAYCGMRGTLMRFDSIPRASKRRITYATRIKRSSEYQAAIADWKAGRVE